MNTLKILAILKILAFVSFYGTLDTYSYHQLSTKFLLNYLNINDI